MFHGKPSTTPSASPAPQEETTGGGVDELQSGDAIGAFTGYVRRAKTSAQGLTAQFFGENGNDADVIAAMHLTRFRDMTVKVTVWLLKNAEGRSMARNGEFPVLAEFIAQLKHPRPSDAGQTAQFFGENGPHSDAINRLNQSDVHDALVHVDIVKAEPGQTAQQIAAGTTGADLTQQAERLTPLETQAIKQQQRKANEGWRLLRVAAFFRSEALWQAMGGEASYAEWLMAQACCHPGEAVCTNSDLRAYKVPGGRRMGYVPLCQEHSALWSSGGGQAGAQSPVAFLTSRQIGLTQQWAEHRLRQTLGVPDGTDPLPGKVYAWAVDHQLRNAIPASFLGLI